VPLKASFVAGGPVSGRVLYGGFFHKLAVDAFVLPLGGYVVAVVEVFGEGFHQVDDGDKGGA